MAKVLIVYGTSESRTALIAKRMASVLSERGHRVSAFDARSAPHNFSPDGFEAVIAAGSVHYGRHQHCLRRFIRRHAAVLRGMPSAFVSVSLSRSRADGRGEAERLAHRFATATGWRPDEVAVFGGAIAYTRYSAFKRILMRSIMNARGGPTNTRRDWEFTDWRAVEGFARGFAARLETHRPPTPSAGEPAEAGPGVC